DLWEGHRIVPAALSIAKISGIERLALSRPVAFPTDVLLERHRLRSSHSWIERESVPVSRTLLNHPVSYARQNSELRFLRFRWNATLRGSSCPYRIAVGTRLRDRHSSGGSSQEITMR